jgi:DNA mismatch repair protein MutL
LIPVVLQTSVEESIQLEDNLERLLELGFVVEPFGPGTFIVKEMPVLFSEKTDRSEIRELVCELVEKLPKLKEDLRHWVLSEAACKKAIKAGEALSGKQMAHLMETLFACDNPWRCPHGRPIILTLSLSDLLRKFGRSGV